MRRLILATLALAALSLPAIALAAGGGENTTAGVVTTSTTTPTTPVCGRKCKMKREYRKARKATPREPIPVYITQCESHGNLRALNPSGAGGRYQIMPTTWSANLPGRHFIVVAHGDRGPRWSSRLLQDRVALNIWRSSGPSAWSCA